MDEVDNDLFERCLHALAAHLSWWIYDPGNSEHPELKCSLPRFLDTNYESDPVKAEISYKIRKIMEPTEADMTQKATMVATFSYQNPSTKQMVKKRAFILCFRGTTSASDWLTNLGAIPNKHLGDSFRDIWNETHLCSGEMKLKRPWYLFSLKWFGITSEASLLERLWPPCSQWLVQPLNSTKLSEPQHTTAISVPSNTCAQGSPCRHVVQRV